MPTNATDVDEFTQSRIVVPLEAVSAANVNECYQALANRTRFLANQLGGVDGQGDWVYRTGGPSRQRSFTVPGSLIAETNTASPSFDRVPLYAQAIRDTQEGFLHLPLKSGQRLVGVDVSYAIRIAPPAGGFVFRILKMHRTAHTSGTPNVTDLALVAPGSPFTTPTTVGNFVAELTLSGTEIVDAETYAYALGVTAPAGTTTPGTFHLLIAASPILTITKPSQEP